MPTCLLFVGLNVVAANTEVNCPEGAYKVEMNSVYDNLKKVICIKTIEGRDLKHGPEVHYRKDGSIAERLMYDTGKQIPWRQSTNTTTNSKKQKASVDGTEKAMEFITNFLNSAVIGARSGFNSQDFKTNKCAQNSNKQWMRFLLLGKGFTQTYRFTTNCDVQGAWSPKIDRPFDMSFQLRNLDSYNKVEMKGVVTIQKGLQTEFSFEVQRGELFSPEGNIVFNAIFKIYINVQSSMVAGKLVPDNHGGSVTFTSIRGKATDKTKKTDLAIIQ